MYQFLFCTSNATGKKKPESENSHVLNTGLAASVPV